MIAPAANYRTPRHATACRASPRLTVPDPALPCNAAPRSAKARLAMNIGIDNCPRSGLQDSMPSLAMPRTATPDHARPDRAEPRRGPATPCQGVPWIGTNRLLLNRESSIFRPIVANAYKLSSDACDLLHVRRIKQFGQILYG
jgi:hypothetical protein